MTGTAPEASDKKSAAPEPASVVLEKQAESQAVFRGIDSTIHLYDRLNSISHWKALLFYKSKFADLRFNHIEEDAAFYSELTSEYERLVIASYAVPNSVGRGLRLTSQAQRSSHFQPPKAKYLTRTDEYPKGETIQYRPCGECRGGTRTCPNCTGTRTVSCPECDRSGRCQTCDGAGRLQCSSCYGNGKCSSCQGSGTGGPCYTCGGSGRVTTYTSYSSYDDNTDDSERRTYRGATTTVCSSCGGSGYRDCSSCGGSGQCSDCGGKGWNTCSNCGGSGRCPTCHGDGVLGCPTCRSIGSVDCPVCEGEGQLTLYTSEIYHFKPNTLTKVTNPSGITRVPEGLNIDSAKDMRVQISELHINAVESNLGLWNPNLENSVNNANGNYSGLVQASINEQFSKRPPDDRAMHDGILSLAAGAIRSNWASTPKDNFNSRFKLSLDEHERTSAADVHKKMLFQDHWHYMQPISEVGLEIGGKRETIVSHGLREKFDIKVPTPPTDPLKVGALLGAVISAAVAYASLFAVIPAGLLTLAYYSLVRGTKRKISDIKQVAIIGDDEARKLHVFVQLGRQASIHEIGTVDDKVFSQLESTYLNREDYQIGMSLSYSIRFDMRREARIINISASSHGAHQEVIKNILTHSNAVICVLNKDLREGKEVADLVGHALGFFGRKKVFVLVRQDAADSFASLFPSHNATVLRVNEINPDALYENLVKPLVEHILFKQENLDANRNLDDANPASTANGE